MEYKNSLLTSRGGWGVSSVACHAAAPGSNPANSNGIFQFIKKLIWTLLLIYEVDISIMTQYSWVPQSWSAAEGQQRFRLQAPH